MGNTVIVALPSVDDKVYKISSEKVPHLTLCFLGEDLSADALAEIVTFTQHAASQLSPFGLSVDYRDELGPDQADVVFFKKDGWSFPRISSFRGHLLQNDTIQKAYQAIDQYPEWTPHLTLGYPEAPAHEDETDYPGIHYVNFDRIAVWMGDFDGPEFRLQYEEDTMSVAMSDLNGGSLEDVVANHIKHYGVKGMRWGVTTKDRAAERTPTNVEVTQPVPGKFAKSTGGKNHPLHPDSEKALAARQKAKSSTTDALSNTELKAAVERMQLEQKFSQLEFQNDRRSKGARFLAGFFGKRKPTKYIDIHEDAGDKTADGVKKAITTYKVAKAAKAAATVAAVV